MRITRKGAPAVAAVLVALAACGLEGADLGDLLSQWEAPLFDNGGFEADGGSLDDWTVTPLRNATGLAVVPPTSSADLQLSAGGTVLTFPRTDATPESQPLQGLTAAADIPRWPKFGTTSAVVNESNGVNSTNANSLKQSYTVGNADVDPNDGKVHARFVLVPALQAAGHAPAQQPYSFVTLRNLTTGATLFTDFTYAHNPGVPWRSQGTGSAAVLYTDWVIHDIVPGNVALRVGDQIELEVIAARCQPGDHFGEVYVDGFGAGYPGLSIRKDAPPLADVDTDIFYDFVVQNNTPGVASNVVADETLPIGTAFVSVIALTPGISCTTPPVGGTGVVSCSLGSMNPGAVGRFLVRVRIYPAAPNGSGTATAGAAGSLTDSTQTWTPNAFAGWTAYLVRGLGAGQRRIILQNTATQLTVTPAWTTVPNNTTAYKIVDPPQESGTISSRTGNTLVDSAKSWGENQWVGYTVTVLSGGGAGQQRLIISNTGNQLTVGTNWGPNPSVGATYAIGLPPDKVVNGNYMVRADAISPLLGPKTETAILAGAGPAELRITVTDGVAAVNWGTPVRYTVRVTNAGPLPVIGARVTDTFPPELTSITWTCAAAGGGTCGAASGSGNIDALINLSLGSTVTFTVNGTVIAGSGFGRLINVASVAVPAGLTDFDPRNNSDADTDTIGPVVLLTVNKDPADSGRGTVMSSPLAINCGPACTSATATFGVGTVVTLTAVARPGDTFTGWAGACSGTAITCDVTMDQAKTVTAHFRGPRVTGVAGPGGTIDCNPPEVVQGSDSVCTITPDPDHALLSVTDNGSTVTGSVSNGTYTVVNVTTDHTVSVTFNARPNFGGPAPTTAAEGSPYTYTPVVTDPDGPGPLTIAIDPTEETCGGVLDPVDGTYRFNPDPSETCVVAIIACDAAGACRTQQTTVTINHFPIAVDDTVLTAGTIDITGETLTANDSPGGSGAESSQTLTVTSVSVVTAQGGMVMLIAGVVTYTPPAGFLGTDTFTYTVMDSGDPALSATATVTVTVTPGGFLDGVGVSGGGCGCSAGAGLAALPWYGIPALLVLARRRRRKDGERPPG